MNIFEEYQSAMKEDKKAVGEAVCIWR